MVTALIVIGSIYRLGHPGGVRAGTMVVVASLALVVNGAAVLILRDGSSDLNIRAAVLHMVGDALASLAVVVAGVVLLIVPTATWLDPGSALVVAAIIVYQAWRVFRGSVAVLLESTPADVDLDELTASMVGVPGVDEVHDLHVWSLSSELRLLSAHMVLTGHPTLEQAQVVSDRVKTAIAGAYSIAHSTLELECERCIDDEDPCRMETLPPTVGSVHMPGSVHTH